MVDSDPAFGQQLFNVSVRKSVAEIPADCHDDHIRREPESRERGPRRTYPTRATRHQLTLPSPSSLDATDPSVPPTALPHHSARSLILVEGSARERHGHRSTG